MENRREKPVEKRSNGRDHEGHPDEDEEGR
jgi:hypothetical protein